MLSSGISHVCSVRFSILGENPSEEVLDYDIKVNRKFVLVGGAVRANPTYRTL